MEDNVESEAPGEVGRNPRSPRISKTRDKRIIEFIRHHPATTRQIADRFFPSDSPETSYKTAARRLAKLRKRKRIHVVGTILRHGYGRPEVVYCGWHPRLADLEHEVMVTELRLKFPDAVFHRQVKVGRTTADARMELEGKTYWIELDMGTMPTKAMQKKWRCYADVREPLLVVCLTEARKRALMRKAILVKDIALFAVLDDLADSYAEAWESLGATDEQT